MEPPAEPIDPLDALVAGDPVPFQAFVARQTPLMVAWFRRAGARPSDAEDLTQDVMLRLFRNAETYASQGRLEGFAFRVARNAWIDHCRKEGLRTPARGGDDDGFEAVPERAGQESSPAVALEHSELRQDLFAAIAGMGDTQREAFRLGVLEERPYSEIAELLGIPVGTVKSRVFHAMRFLRERLKSQGEDR
ncbi:MAG: RNA polymerase sigma factor [Planctomycetota bacterium]